MNTKTNCINANTWRALSLAVVVFLFGCFDNNIELNEVIQAVDLNDTRALKLFLDQGGDPDMLSESGSSMLYIATGPHGGHGVLEMLLEAGANPNIGNHSYTPLMNASSWCNLSSVKTLIKFGADVSIENSRGKTALETVCISGDDREQVIQFLNDVKEGL
ncbi:MAG: ankyrin repeat domain-containing protein [Arenicella sp.]